MRNERKIAAKPVFGEKFVSRFYLDTIMTDEFANDLKKNFFFLILKLMPKRKFIRKVCLYNGYDYDDTGDCNTNGRLSNIRLWKW